MTDRELIIDALRGYKKADSAVKVEVIKGTEGHCLAIMLEHGGRRVAGPKPWGGGRTVHSFEVPVREILDALPGDASEDALRIRAELEDERW